MQNKDMRFLIEELTHELQSAFIAFMESKDREPICFNDYIKILLNSNDLFIMQTLECVISEFKNKIKDATIIIDDTN